MQISVIIPTCNPDNYFHDCLLSLTKQTLLKKDFEVLVVVNGCIEERINYIIEESQWFSKEINVRVFYSEKKGVSNARNVGLASASGKFICFIDDDDLISENYLSDLLSKSDENVIVVSNVYAFNESIENVYTDYITHSFLKNSVYKDKIVRSKLRAHSFFSSSCCKLIPKEIIGNRIFDANFAKGEDSLFMALISDKVMNVVLADEKTIYFRRVRPTSVSNRKTNNKEDIKQAIKVSCAFLRIYLSSPFKYNVLFFLNRILVPYYNLLRHH